MTQGATLQVRMDAALKQEVEALYRRMGTTFVEAVRVFAAQSVAEGAMPFRPTVAWGNGDRPLGIADGRFTIPEDIDQDNPAIAEMFGVEA